MGIIEDVKEVVKLSQQVNNIDLYHKLVDLQLEVMELTEQLKQKDTVISQLKKAFALKGKFICKDSAYYLTDEKDEIIDGPFCTKCFEVDQIQCRLVQKKTPSQGRETVQCPRCKVPFPSYRTAYYLSKH